MNTILDCPDCHSHKVKKNGQTHNQKQNHKCNCCARQCILNPTKKSVSDQEKQIVRGLLGERISLRGICRAMKRSLS